MTGASGTTQDQSIGSGARPRVVPLAEIRGLQIRRGTTESGFTVEIKRLAIPRGGFTSILGASGCGKTSLLMVLGLMRGLRVDDDFGVSCEDMWFNLPRPLPGDNTQYYPVFHRACLDGRGRLLNVEQCDRLRRQIIGFCLQGGELIPSLSLLDNVAVPRRLCGQDTPERSARERLRTLDLDGDSHSQIGKLPGMLSGGQKQRGVVARALVHDPPLVILDEPTSALDELTAREALDRLKSRSPDQTVVMVTHNEELAADYSDYIVKMGVLGEKLGGIREQLCRNEAGEWERCDALIREPPQGARPTGKVAMPIGTLDAPKGPQLRYYMALGVMDALGPAYRWPQKVWDRLRGNAARELDTVEETTTFSFVAQLCKNSLVVVAIGLLVLLMRGMSAGLIAEFREDLTKSPTARELKITPMGEALNAEQISGLTEEFPSIEMVIPESQHVLSTDEGLSRDQSVTVLGTLPMDPRLSVVHRTQDFSGLNLRSVVLPEELAERLAVNVGDSLTLWVARALDAKSNRKQVKPAKLAVNNILPGSGQKIQAHLDFTSAISKYKSGRPVPEFGWEGLAIPAIPRYESYLLLAKQELSGREREILRARGLRAEEMTADVLEETLAGVLKKAESLTTEGRTPLIAYRVESGRQEGGHRWLYPNQGKVENLLSDSDGIMLPWNPPLEAEMEGRPLKLLGLSGRARWLRSYLKHRRAIYPRGSDNWEIAAEGRTKSVRSQNLQVTLGGQVSSLRFDLHQNPSAEQTDGEVVDQPSDPKKPVALGKVVPPSSESAIPLVAVSAEKSEDTNRLPAAGPPREPEAGQGNAAPVVASDPADPSEPSGPVAAGEDTATLATAAGEPELPRPPQVMVVPAAVLAHMHMAAFEAVVADPEMRMFRSVPDEASWTKARAFVRDVFDVTSVHATLSQRGFAVISQNARVKEVRRYISVLDTLVQVLSVIALAIAMATVVIVFHDVAESKKRMIGILRIMGLSKSGVVILLMVRGVLVAVTAMAMLVTLGESGALLLNQLQLSCRVTVTDYALVGAVILGICMLGTYLTGRAVAKLDPVLALEEAQKQA